MKEARGAVRNRGFKGFLGFLEGEGRPDKSTDDVGVGGFGCGWVLVGGWVWVSQVKQKAGKMGRAGGKFDRCLINVPSEQPR